MESTDPRKPPCLAKRLWLEEEESAITWSDLESLQFTTLEGMS